MTLAAHAIAAGATGVQALARVLGSITGANVIVSATVEQTADFTGAAPTSTGYTLGSEAVAEVGPNASITADALEVRAHTGVAITHDSTKSNYAPAPLADVVSVSQGAVTVNVDSTTGAHVRTGADLDIAGDITVSATDTTDITVTIDDVSDAAREALFAGAASTVLAERVLPQSTS